MPTRARYCYDMELGLTMEKFLLIAVIAAVIIGPERLPEFAQKFAGWVRKAGEMIQGAKSSIKDEMGDAAGDVDWRSLDPRQYDPRRIIRDALLDDPKTTSTAAAATAAGMAATAAATMQARAAFIPGTFSAAYPPPFDPEAT